MQITPDVEFPRRKSPSRVALRRRRPFDIDARFGAVRFQENGSGKLRRQYLAGQGENRSTAPAAIRTLLTPRPTRLTLRSFGPVRSASRHCGLPTLLPVPSLPSTSGVRTRWGLSRVHGGSSLFGSLGRKSRQTDRSPAGIWKSRRSSNHEMRRAVGEFPAATNCYATSAAKLREF
jgi:hypothetical protein